MKFLLLALPLYILIGGNAITNNSFFLPNFGTAFNICKQVTNPSTNRNTKPGLNSIYIHYSKFVNVLFKRHQTPIESITLSQTNINHNPIHIVTCILSINPVTKGLFI